MNVVYHGYKIQIYRPSVLSTELIFTTYLIMFQFVINTSITSTTLATAVGVASFPYRDKHIHEIHIVNVEYRGDTKYYSSEVES